MHLNLFGFFYIFKYDVIKPFCLYNKMHFKNYKKYTGQVLNYSSNNWGAATLKDNEILYQTHLANVIKSYKVKY